MRRDLADGTGDAASDGKDQTGALRDACCARDEIAARSPKAAIRCFAGREKF
jgi:hypothetical protein